MKLTITTQDEDFATRYIPEVLKEYINSNYSEAKAKKLNDFLYLHNVKSGVKGSLMYAIETLKFSKEGENYVLEVDKNKILEKTAFNIDTIVNLITYGTVDIRGYNLLVNSFEFVARKINSLKKSYMSKKSKKGE
jgi:hypothetical protein